MLRPHTGQITQKIPSETMADVVERGRARTHREAIPPIADPSPSAVLGAPPRFKLGARLLPLIAITNDANASQASIPYGGQPDAVALAHRIAARIVDILGDEVRAGVADLPAVNVTKWSASVRVEHETSAGAVVAHAFRYACATEARAGGKATHRVGGS